MGLWGSTCGCQPLRSGRSCRPAGRQRLDAVDALDPAEGDRTVEIQTRHPRREKSERLLKFGPGEIGAEAIVRPGPERQQLAVAAGGDVESLPGLTFTVGAFRADRDDGAARKDDTVVLDVLQAESCGEGGDRFHPQNFRHRGGNQIRGDVEQRPLVGVGGEQVERMGQLALGGIDRAGQDVDSEVDALEVRESLPVGLRGQQRGQQRRPR
jgi:hypothetical protein